MPGDSSLEHRIRARVHDLRADGLLRTLRPPSGVDLSSNDYLNLASDRRLVQAFMAGAEREGCGSTGSRLLRGHRAGFAAIEERFARFKGAERSLFFSSGYLANLAVLSTLCESGDVVFSDERNHASLIDGLRLSRARIVVCPHADVRAMAALMDAATDARIRFVMIESLYSMDGDLLPLGDYAELCRVKDAVLIVDEAHAVGVYGALGAGLIEAAGIDPNRCISINPAGKALGVSGAFVAGPEWAIEYLVQRARSFAFSTAPPPSVAYALDASLTIVSEEPSRRERLFTLARHLRERLKDVGIVVPEGVTQIVPVVIGDNGPALAVAERLQAEGFDVRAIRPPSVPDGTARLRISLNAALTEAILDDFARALSAALSRVGLCSAVSS